MKRFKAKSLQVELYLWIIASTLLVMLIGSAVSGAIAFFQARELQDNTLTEISVLLKSGKLTPPAVQGSLSAELDKYHNASHQEKNTDEDTSIILFELAEPYESFKEKHLARKGDGLQTIDFLDEQWRVLIVTRPQSGRKFAIAQPTELRDEIAVASAMSTLYPLMIFVASLLLLIHLVLRKQFKPIKQLAASLDQQDGMHPVKLSDSKIPSEIQPFVHSINALIQRVQSAMEKQQRFIADAAHELRTPITALSLQAENLKNAADAQEHDERLLTLQQGFLRLGNLVGQLLDLARLQANVEAADLNRKGNSGESIAQTVSLNDTVKHVIQDSYPLAEAGNIDLGVIRQDEKLRLKDANGILSQLIQNAIANAIHYTPEKGEVNISLFKENNCAVLLVEDTGIGIPEDELEKVMEPFYRVLGSGKAGNGLGLTISQEIADKLGGKITLANRSSGGLVFRYEQLLTQATGEI